MKLVFAGTPQTAVPSLEALIGSDHEVAAVITRPDSRQGRGRVLRPSPVAECAQDHGIAVLKPQDVNSLEFLRELDNLQADCFPVVAYGALLQPAALALGQYGWLNLHFSVLPAWRGAAPVQHSVMAGDEVTGATVFSIVPELDAGPVLGHITERIRPEDTAGTLLDRLADEGAKLLLEVLNRIGEITAVPQQPDGVSFAPKLTVEDARIDWDAPAFVIDRHIRGCTPDPGAWTTLDEVRIKVWPIAGAAENTLNPGQIAVTKREVRVGTATADVILGDVQARGKKRMAASDWARGMQLTHTATLR